MEEKTGPNDVPSEGEFQVIKIIPRKDKGSNNNDGLTLYQTLYQRS